MVSSSSRRASTPCARPGSYGANGVLPRCRTPERPDSSGFPAAGPRLRPMRNRPPDDVTYRAGAAGVILGAMGDVTDSPPSCNRSSSGAPIRTEFRILGALEVDVARAAVPLGGRKQQAVLAHLIV